MEFEIVSTGSKGNAVVLDRSILVDCGVPFKWLSDVYKDLRLVLLTHSHGDHFQAKTIARLAAERPTLRIACCPWLGPAVQDAGVPLRQIDILHPATWYEYGLCSVRADETVHDVRNCCWHIFTKAQKAFYATDTRNLNGIDAKGYDLYMVEANYIDEEIREKIAEKKLNGEFIYEKRVLREHMSKKTADDWLYSQMSPNSAYIYMHCHRDSE